MIFLCHQIKETVTVVFKFWSAVWSLWLKFNSTGATFHLPLYIKCLAPPDTHKVFFYLLQNCDGHFYCVTKLTKLSKVQHEIACNLG